MAAPSSNYQRGLSYVRFSSTILSPLFLQLTLTNYYQIVKHLKSFKIIIVAPTCFGLHKPSSGSSQPVLRQSYSVDFGYISFYEIIGIVAAYAATIPITLAKHRLRAP